MSANPYGPEASQPLVFQLCDVTATGGGEPTPNLGAVLLAFDPTSEVSVRRATKYNEEENKATGATVIEMKKFDQPVEISFSVELLTDDPPTSPIRTALEKYQELTEFFEQRDDTGKKVLYAPVYPLIPASVQFVFWDKLEVQDTIGADCVVAQITLREVISAPKPTSGGGGGGGGGGGEPNDEAVPPPEGEGCEDEWDNASDAIDEESGDSGEENPYDDDVSAGGG